jgi:hypothetical protein
MRFGVLTAIKMSILVLWFAPPCGLAGRYQSLVTPERWCILPISPHGVTSQKTNIDILCSYFTSVLFQLYMRIVQNDLQHVEIHRTRKRLERQFQDYYC